MSRGGLRLTLATLALACGSPAGAEDPVLSPSGFNVTVHEILNEAHPYSGDITLVIRLIAPAIASPVFAANLQADMQWACEEWGLSEAETFADPPAQIVVELMEAVVPRGAADPETVQFFETYSLQNDLCIWELF